MEGKHMITRNMFLKPTEIRDFVCVPRAPIGNAVQFGEMFKSDN